MPDQTDPIQFEVIRNALLEATEEMAIALRRSAYSTNIKTRADFSCAFFDRQLRPVAQAFTQPVHLGSLTILTPRAVAEYGPENLQAGDAILVNDPYRGGVHLNDITLISPVYCGEELFGYVANLAHHVDVGGGAPASIGAFQQVYQEGIIIPPVKLVRGGEIAADVFELVIAQIRSKRETRGDFRAQVAANHSGIRRLNALAEQVGLAQASFYMDRLIDYTRERTLSELAKLPKGEFTATGVVDNDGFTDEPVRLQVRVAIDDEGSALRPDGVRSAAPGTGQFHVLPDLCGLRLCPQVPDRPRRAGQRRLLRTGAARSSRRDGRQLHGTLAGSRGLGDPSAALRYHSQGPASGAAR